MKINNINEFITSPDMSGYDSPIRMIVGKLETKMENDILTAIKRYGIDVDKDELIKALNYDREQYEKGFKEGYQKGYLRAAENIIKALTDTIRQEGVSE